MKIFYKIFIFIVILNSLVFASIKGLDSQITQNKKQYRNEANKKKKINKNIINLTSKILKENKTLVKITKNLSNLDTTLVLNKSKLKRTKKQLEVLKDKSIHLRERKSDIEIEVVEFVTQRYAMSLGIKQTNKKSKKSIIDKEVYNVLFENAKDEVLNLNIDYLKINSQIRQNISLTKQLKIFIKEQQHVKKEYLNIKKEQEKTVSSLKIKHKLYQKYLISVETKQGNITDLLGSLNILKKKEIADIKKEKKRLQLKKEKQRKLALAKERKALDKQKKALAKEKKVFAQKTKKHETQKTKMKPKEIVAVKKAKARIIKKEQEIQSKQMKLVTAKNLDIKVRNLGSSAKGIKILKYRGKKTIAPLKSYEITKKFGKYYDKVYNMKLFNESVSLKTRKQNAKVFNVFKGQVVYAKQNAGLLAKVVIVKHAGNLHTIYSHLDKISPTIKVGKWIPKGYVVGRVSDTLLFQATKSSKYIDPTQLFK